MGNTIQKEIYWHSTGSEPSSRLAWPGPHKKSSKLLRISDLGPKPLQAWERRGYFFSASLRSASDFSIPAPNGTLPKVTLIGRNPLPLEERALPRALYGTNSNWVGRGASAWVCHGDPGLVTLPDSPLPGFLERVAETHWATGIGKQMRLGNWNPCLGPGMQFQDPPIGSNEIVASLPFHNCLGNWAQWRQAVHEWTAVKGTREGEIEETKWGQKDGHVSSDFPTYLPTYLCIYILNSAVSWIYVLIIYKLDISVRVLHRNRANKI